MKILAIETSCDDTSVAVIETSGSVATTGTPCVRVLSSVVSSQTELHTQFGGVVPNLARREHEKNLPFVLAEAIQKAGFSDQKSNSLLPREDPPAGGKNQNVIQKSKIARIRKILVREPEFLKQLLATPHLLLTPPIDAIAVTQGPGLEPALWVGVNAARVLAVLWDKPLIAVNHMEGHLAAILLSQNGSENAQVLMTNDKSMPKIEKPKTTHYSLLTTHSPKVRFPAIGLLVSGGHTQLVLIKKWGDYTIIGETRDDAVGETFDKVARMLGLPYPGGPPIAKLAMEARNSKFEIRKTRKLKNSQTEELIHLPRPMLRTNDYDFSFSGLKTAVLYLVRDLVKERGNIDTLKPAIAHEFQEAAVEVLVTKTLRAIREHKAKTVILGGGVAANDLLRKSLGFKIQDSRFKTTLFLPEKKLTTDNAAMIGAAAIFKASTKTYVNPTTLKARADLRL